MPIPNDAAPLGIALLGLILGIRHATDADHVIAVTTIVSSERRLGAAARIGIAWGLGHSVTVFLVGGAIILFKVAIPQRLAMAMEFVVAIVLILLGVSAMARSLPPFLARRSRKTDEMFAHSHSHQHGGMTHTHPHAHAHGDNHSSDAHRDHLVRKSSRFTRGSHERAFGVGLVHGLAGSAAVALLVLSAIPHPLWGMVYLAIFGIGTVIGMALITTAIGLPLSFSAARLGGLNNALVFGAGLLSIGFGVFLAYQIGFADGLLISGPAL